MPIDVVEKVEGGCLRVRTPLDLIRALTTQIPDPGQHMVLYYDWHSNRSRGARAAARGAA